MTSLVLLPAEVIFHILSYIDDFTVIHTVRRVSQRLRILSDAAYPHLYGLPVSLWIKIIYFLPTQHLPRFKTICKSFNNLLSFMIEMERLPLTHYGKTPVTPEDIFRAKRPDITQIHPFLLGIEYWYTYWRRYEGRRSITAAPSLLFECASGLPVDRMVIKIASLEYFPEGATREFTKLVLRKRRRHKVITNLDALVAVDQMLGQGVNEVCLQIRDGVLCISKRAKDFEAVHLGGIDEGIRYIDDVIEDDDFLGKTAENKLGLNTTRAQFVLGGRRNEKLWDSWILMYVRRFAIF